jgi:HAT1-interacting factor 1
MSSDPQVDEQTNAQHEAPTNDAMEEPATQERLTELISSANLQYSLKRYDAAAEIYSQATEMQATLNGEMVPANAELLYLYGRCLFKVAVLRSDVLGGQVAGEAPKPKSKTNGAAKKEETPSAPFFQVLDSDDEDEEEEGDGEDEEEEDDFATAYEILDVARVLFAQQMEDMENAEAGAESTDKGKGKITANSTKAISPELRHIKERLADTHDLQAEISLENENFEGAIEDSRSTIQLRQEIDPIDSGFLAEAHYKLALSLEFTFFKSVREAKEGQIGSTTASDVQPTMLYEAIENLVAAITSCEARIKKEESKLAELLPEEAWQKKSDIAEVIDIVNEMMTRVSLLFHTSWQQLICPASSLTSKALLYQQPPHPYPQSSHRRR